MSRWVVLRPSWSDEVNTALSSSQRSRAFAASGVGSLRWIAGRAFVLGLVMILVGVLAGVPQETGRTWVVDCAPDAPSDAGCGFRRETQPGVPWGFPVAIVGGVTVLIGGAVLLLIRPKANSR